MDNSLMELYRAKRISRQNAISFSMNPELMNKKIGAN
jgi:hypothetical protein